MYFIKDFHKNDKRINQSKYMPLLLAYPSIIGHLVALDEHGDFK